jgi:hypothetical protein
MKQCVRAMVLLSSVLTIPAMMAFPQAPAPVKASTTQPAKIGTYDKVSIVIAFYRSPQWEAILQQKQDEKVAAMKSSNAAKVKELNDWGLTCQEVAMQQVLGAAPMDNILEVLKPAFREIERKQGLAAIVEFPGTDPDAVKVDVTAQLMDWLQANDKTRQLASDMRDQQEKLHKEMDKPCPTLPAVK